MPTEPAATKPLARTVLGIDLAYARTGVALVECGIPGRERIVTSSVLTTHKSEPDNTRAAQLAQALTLLATGTDLVAVEVPYIDPTKSSAVALRLARLGGAVEAALVAAGHRVVKVAAASRIKTLGLGKGKRGQLKARAVLAVESRYGLTVSDDEADAIGVALAGYAKATREDRAPGQAKLGIKPGRRHAKRKPVAKLPAAVQAAADRAQEEMPL